MVILNLNEQPPLIQAIFGGGLEDVRIVLTCKPDVNLEDGEKRTPLHAAAFKGDAQIVSMLLQSGAKVNVRDNKWLTPLHRACFTGSEDTVATLLQFQADVCCRDRQWQTPLHIAAANQALECVGLLLDAPNANVNVTDRSGRTAMHHAALNGHIDVIDVLLARGAFVNACDKKDCRPLHYAAHFGHVDVVELLIKNGADVNAVDRNQYSPLHVAAASGMVSACRVLLNHPSALINIQNSYGNTPLHLACLNGHLPVCQELLAYRADADAVNYRGQTPLHISAASTHGVLCLNHLLQQRAQLCIDINAQSEDGRTALHMTAIHGRFTRSKTLIDNGAIVDSTDKNGCTALHIAAQFGHDTLTNTLISFGADITKRGYEGRTPLHMSCLSGYIECCRKLLQAGADLDSPDDTGKTPTHCAAYKGSVECLDLLVSKGADFRRLDHTGQTALHLAAAQGHFDCVFTLVGIGSTVNVCDNEGCTPLHLASAHDIKGKCVEYLLQHNADPHKADKGGFTAIHYAVAGGNMTGLSFLLSAVGPCCSFTKGDLSLTTPLHLAARVGNVDILRQMLPHFPDANVRCAQGRTPLLLAAREGHAPCVQMLLRYGAKVALTDALHNMSPVHYAARNGHVHCLALLVDNTEDVGVINRKDKFERTALMLAVSGGYDCVVALLKSDADPNIVDNDKHSALFRAVVAGQNDIVQFLISKDAKVNGSDVNGKTVLHLAAACGHYICLQSLLDHMTADEAALLDKQQFSALHWACYSGNTKCVQHLLRHKRGYNALTGNPFSVVHCAAYPGCVTCLELLLEAFGADIVRLRDARKRTPLHLACAHGHEYYAGCLLKRGSEVDAQDDQGRTPLHAAAHNGQSHLLDILKGKKADITIYDNNGNTALHIACLRKHSVSALMLLDAIDDVDIINMVNNNRETPLHLSARNGLVDVTRQLIRKGSSVLAVNSNGLTPALCCAPNLNVAQCLSIILASHPGMQMQNGDKSRLSKDTVHLSCNSPPTLCVACLNAPMKQIKFALTQTELSLQRNHKECLVELFGASNASFGRLFDYDERDRQSIAKARRREKLRQEAAYALTNRVGDKLKKRPSFACKTNIDIVQYGNPGFIKSVESKLKSDKTLSSTIDSNSPFILEEYDDLPTTPIIEETGFQLHRSLSQLSLGLEIPSLDSAHTLNVPPKASEPTLPIDWLSTVSGRYFEQKYRDSIDAFEHTRNWVDTDGRLSHLADPVEAAGDVLETAIGIGESSEQILRGSHSFDTLQINTEFTPIDDKMPLNKSNSCDTFQLTKQQDNELALESAMFIDMAEYIEIDCDSLDTKTGKDRHLEQVKNDCVKIIEHICNSFIPLEQSEGKSLEKEEACDNFDAEQVIKSAHDHSEVLANNQLPIEEKNVIPITKLITIQDIPLKAADTPLTQSATISDLITPGYKHVENYEDVYKNVLAPTSPKDSHLIGDGIKLPEDLSDRDDDITVRRIGKTCCDSLCIRCINHNMFDPVESNLGEEVCYTVDLCNSSEGDVTAKNESLHQQEKRTEKFKSQEKKFITVRNKKTTSILDEFHLKGARMPRQYPTFFTIPGMNTLTNFSKLQLKVAANASNFNVTPDATTQPTILAIESLITNDNNNNNNSSEEINCYDAKQSSIESLQSQSILINDDAFIDNLSQKLSENMSQVCAVIANVECVNVVIDNSSNDSLDSVTMESSKLSDFSGKSKVKTKKRQNMQHLTHSTDPPLYNGVHHDVDGEFDERLNNCHISNHQSIELSSQTSSDNEFY